jgi:hypothetical protein
MDGSRTRVMTPARCRRPERTLRIAHLPPISQQIDSATAGNGHDPNP